MAMPAVYGVAAKLADHLDLPPGPAAQQMQALDCFLRKVENDPAWTKSVHNLFKISMAENWSCRNRYSMDPAVAVCLGPTGAMLVLHGPGEVQDMSGQIGISCRWLHARAVDMNTAFNAVGNYDCEDGASLFAALLYIACYSSMLHLSQKRDMFASMPEIMPETDRYCPYTQQCAARILLMVGAQERACAVSGVSYVCASAASAEQAEHAKAQTGQGGPEAGPEAGPAAGQEGRPGPPEAPVSAIYNTWGRLVGPTPSAGGHAVCMQGSVTGDATTCEIDSGELGTMQATIQRLQFCRPLESTALVYPAAPSKAVVLHGVNVRNSQAVSVSVLPDSGTSVSVPKCLSLCSATLAEEAVKILPPDTHAKPVFVQAVGTPGFYQGSYNVGDVLVFTATDKNAVQKMRQVRKHTLNEEMLKGVCDRANKMTPGQVLEEMKHAGLCAWAQYEDMGPAEEPATGSVYVLKTSLFADEAVACHYVARQARAEVPDVATLRQYMKAPLSMCRMRRRTLMPPVQCRPVASPAARPAARPAAPQRTAQPLPACTLPPSEYWGQSVPVMVCKRNPVTGMSTIRECESENMVLTQGEELGAFAGRCVTESCAITEFHMQHQ
jgi:hypothetical protein